MNLVVSTVDLHSVLQDSCVMCVCFCRKWIFDGPQADPSEPLEPEDRPGGYDWGEGAAPDGGGGGGGGGGGPAGGDHQQ